MPMPVVACYCENRGVEEQDYCKSSNDKTCCRRKQALLLCEALEIDWRRYDNYSVLETELKKRLANKAGKATFVKKFTKNSAGNEADLFQCVKKWYSKNAQKRNKRVQKKSAKAKKKNKEELTAEEEVLASHETSEEKRKKELVPLFKHVSEGNAEPASDYLRNCSSSKGTKVCQQQMLTSNLALVVEGIPKRTICGNEDCEDSVSSDNHEEHEESAVDNDDSKDDKKGSSEPSDMEQEQGGSESPLDRDEDHGINNSDFDYDTDSRNNMNRLLLLSPDLTVKMLEALLLATSIPTALKVLGHTDGHFSYHYGLFKICHTMTDTQMVRALMILCHWFQGQANKASKRKAGNTYPQYSAAVSYGTSSPQKSHTVHSSIRCDDDDMAETITNEGEAIYTFRKKILKELKDKKKPMVSKAFL